MTDKFVVSTNEIGEIIVTDVETDRVYRYDDISNFFGLIRLLNEQQATITELERKLNKYAKIGEEQLKQIIELQDELNECRARPTLATDERGVVKVEYR